MQSDNKRSARSNEELNKKNLLNIYYKSITAPSTFK